MKLISIMFLWFSLVILMTPSVNNATTEPTAKIEIIDTVFEFEEEAYIDDIPFDTEKIYNEVFFTYYYTK